MYKKNPEAEIIAHPESETHILKTAAYVGSTAGMIDFVKKDTTQNPTQPVRKPDFSILEKQGIQSITIISLLFVVTRV